MKKLLPEKHKKRVYLCPVTLCKEEFVDGNKFVEHLRQVHGFEETKIRKALLEG